MPSDSCHPNAKYDSIRANMVAAQIEARGVQDPAILAAMATVPRERFVSANHRHKAYTDQPLAISHGQTISQPYIVAAMIELAAVESRSRVLEIGTGSGYQAAVLVAMGARVFTIELEALLATRAARDLARIGLSPEAAKSGDGYGGWPEHAPFDAIIVTAAPDHVPPALVEQPAVGGRMILPVGDLAQELVRLRKTEDSVVRETLIGVRFVPMRGEAKGHTGVGRSR